MFKWANGLQEIRNDKTGKEKGRNRAKKYKKGGAKMANKKILSKKLISNITKLIEGGETNISKICSLVGISRSVWYKWEAGKNTQFAARLSRAHARRKAIEDEKMVCESKRSLLLLLQGFFVTITEVKTEFLDEGGERVTTTITTKHIPPCTNTIIFFLTNKDKANFQSTIKRHVNAKKRYVLKTADKPGARILTHDEALALGVIDYDYRRNPTYN